ncbi:uncharacterized protein LOC111251757 isoform X2 [Varroa destructor]|uniref:Telomere-associated protein Rif1 N-terminal domain-containing protein n=1 Tax=Varroa destructor TaxID=109461 RepID=A0A7M7KBJ1_VARDE|nr:uncharacterized protein LOC111251757 isoform X2 [Varroa destructor]
MDFKEPSSQAEATEALTKFREQWAASLDTERVVEAFEWLEKLDGRWEQMHVDILCVMGELAAGTMELVSCRRIIEYLKRNSHRCKGDAGKAYVGIAIMVHLLKDESTAILAGNVLSSVRTAVYKDEATLASVIDMFKTKLVPKMKELADNKKFLDALALWRAMVRFTGFEKVPTAVTNGVLHIATLAFKETNPSVHADAFSSWRILVESLPRYMLKKPAYIKLLLNPLNRVYRDTDAATTPHKFGAWWQVVRSLEDDIEAHFDDVVFPLINKIFSIPSAKTRQVNPTAFASPTREIPQEAYAILALILYKGTIEIMTEMSKLNDNLPINEHTIKDACFVKHQTLLTEVFTLVLNNIVHGVTPPPQGYPYLLAKILLSRISSLYDNGHYGLVRAFLSMIYKLVQARLFDTEQMLSVFSDLANGVPHKVMVSSQFNLRDGSSSMHECPIMSLTAFFVQHVPTMCEKERHDAPALKITKNKRTYRQLLKALLECGSAGMNFLHFADHASKSLAQAEGVLQTDSWLEIADHLSSFIKHTHEVNQGGSLEHDFSALINTLKYPFRPNLSLTSDVIKKWTDLFTVFAIDAALVKDVGVNQHIEELCAHLLDELSKTEFDLNRLMFCSQAFETVTKQACLETVTIGKKIPLGNLHSLVKCVSLLANRSHEFIQSKKQLKSNCQFFINIVHICSALIQRTNDVSLCRHLLLTIVPEILPLLEHTKNKAAVRETSLTLVELPLLHALAMFADAFVDRAEKVGSSSENEKFFQMARSAIEHGSGHWKSNIRDPFVRYAKFLSVPLSQPEQVSQSFSQDVVVDDVSPVTIQSKTPVKAATPTSGATVKRRSSRKATKEDEEFTPIKTAKKKSIFTEHQLEKQSESKIIPSMYQDLSQSIDKISSQQNGPTNNSNNQLLITETRVVAPVIDEDAVFEDITPKEMEQEKAPIEDDDSKRASKVKHSLAGKDTEADGVKPIESGDTIDIKELHRTPIEQALPAIVPQEVIPATSPETPIVVTDNNNENEEPLVKKKKRFSYSETDDMPEPVVVIDNQPSTLSKMVEMMQNEQQEREKEETIPVNSPLRPQGARKRKLTGQPIESPITAKLQQRNFMINSPSSRSRMMLEAAQARHTMNAGPVVQSSTVHSEGRHALTSSTPWREKAVAFASTERTVDSGSPQPSSNGGFATPVSPTVGRSILKRVSTGASVKKVSFSRANEVCAYDKHPRVSTAKSLFPPVMVQSDQNSSTETSHNSLKGVDLDQSMHVSDTNKLAKEEESTTISATSSVAPAAVVDAPTSESIVVESMSSDLANDPSKLDESSIVLPDITIPGQGESKAPASDPPIVESKATMTLKPSTPKVTVSEEVSLVRRIENAADTLPIETNKIAESINIVECIKSAHPEQLTAVLELIVSDKFIQTLSPEVRGTFFSKCLATMSSYQCRH